MAVGFRQESEDGILAECARALRGTAPGDFREGGGERGLMNATQSAAKGPAGPEPPPPIGGGA